MLKQLITGATLLSAATAPTLAADKNMPFGQVGFEIYRTAVEMRTAKGQEQVPLLMNYLSKKFISGGFAEEDVHALPIGKTGALVVRYRGDGSSGKKPISISAHMDVVDALRKDWTEDPFKLIEKDGFYLGRGTLDNKAGLTAVTTVFLRLKAEGWVPNRDLIIAFSGDEETSMASTKALVSEFRSLIDSEFMLNADAGGGLLPEDGSTPPAFGMQAAEKTYVTFTLTVRNPGGHSSRPRNDNAIYDLADALHKIQAYRFPVRQNELTKAFFEGTGPTTPGALGKAMTAFAKNPKDQDAIKTLRTSSDYIGTIGTTCVATMLSAGHAENALPQSATATVNCRVFPGEGVQNTENTLKKIVGNDAIEFKMISNPVESDASPLRADILAAVQQAVNTKYPNLKIIPSMSSGGTDGMHFRAAGIPSYGVNGIYIKSSDRFAHGLNERLPVVALYDNFEHWYVLLKAIAS